MEKFQLISAIDREIDRSKDVLISKGSKLSNLRIGLFTTFIALLLTLNLDIIPDTEGLKSYIILYPFSLFLLFLILFFCDALSEAFFPKKVESNYFLLKPSDKESIFTITLLVLFIIALICLIIFLLVFSLSMIYVISVISLIIIYILFIFVMIVYVLSDDDLDEDYKEKKWIKEHRKIIAFITVILIFAFHLGLMWPFGHIFKGNPIFTIFTVVIIYSFFIFSFYYLSLKMVIHKHRRYIKKFNDLKEDILKGDKNIYEGSDEYLKLRKYEKT